MKLKLATFALLLAGLFTASATKAHASQAGCVNYLEVHPTSWNTGIFYFYQQCWEGDSWGEPFLLGMGSY